MESDKRSAVDALKTFVTNPAPASAKLFLAVAEALRCARHSKTPTRMSDRRIRLATSPRRLRRPSAVELTENWLGHDTSFPSSAWGRAVQVNFHTIYFNSPN